jgi:hypothetical protein
MRGFLMALPLLLAAGPASGDDGFQVKPAQQYQARQEQSGVIVAVQPYRGEQEQKDAFGKAHPSRYGFLPVLLVITNNSDHPLGLEGLKARFIDARREGLEPVSGEDLAYYNPKGHQPKDRPSYIPIPLGRPKAKKGPLAKPEITQREFKAPVVAPNTTASGFFYYNTGTGSNPVEGASMYISGIRDMTTGSDLFYFEIPLSAFN